VSPQARATLVSLLSLAHSVGLAAFAPVWGALAAHFSIDTAMRLSALGLVVGSLPPIARIRS
jgi:hypothetical protein